MAEKQTNKDALFDNRIVWRNIRSGHVDRDAYDQYLASLPDLSEQCEDIGEEIYRARRHGVALTGDFISNEHDDE